MRLILPAIVTVVLILILRPILKMDGLLGLWNVAKVIIGLGFVIFFHELGHFLVAKWCDVHVQTFSIGFGPALPGCSFQWGETLYKIALFPLGGYVKMVGETADDEESADDPRSFKKKSVGQRMAIISAGVIMNVILAGICFSIVYQLHGVKRHPAEIAAVEAGSAAWQKGIPSGALIERIDNVEYPYFDDLMPMVMHSQAGEKLTITYQSRAQQSPKTIEIEPRRRKGDDQPFIGVRPPDELELVDKKGRKPGLPPVLRDSAADHATPSFAFGDQILATTDPDDPAKLRELPPNPFAPDRKDYYAFYERLVRLEGKPMVIQVHRAGAPPDAAPVNIQVPPAYHFTFGMRMRMGQIVAVRDGSSAQAQGIVARNAQQALDGDIIKQVEVVEPDGSKTRFVTAPDKTPSNDNAKEIDVDPMRLPFELEQWARRVAGEGQSPRKVTLTVFRGLEHKKVSLELPWDESWRFDREIQSAPASPLSIPELGIAYRVEGMVEGLAPGSPAAQAGIKKGDIIEAVRFQEWDWETRQAVAGSEWVELDLDQWAWVSATLQKDFYRQVSDFQQVTFRIKRGENESLELAVTAQPDPTWPVPERGWILMPDLRLQKADGFGSAVALGFGRTYSVIVQTLQQVRALMTRRVAPTKGISGPISIVNFLYGAAGTGFYEFLYLLGIISVSLAVINFLPIPLLDGGHMAFLTYEWVRGKPAPEQVQIALMYLGLLIILSLMFFAFYVDWRNWHILKFLFGK
jgi:regulator of sigma E protease